MDELVKMVSQKVGMSEVQARQAVEVVGGYLKEKLLQDIASSLGGLLGKK